ncbi:hypothetical protein V6N12_013112 [Hibiscus sabdariffa]|uniref:Uncharacterized protein n=1 Tax=Hibiscus sabdariffa TaxID=183260 RepID=A0ABR2EGC4_9ROSI
MISLMHHFVGLISRYVVPFDLLYTLTVQVRLSMLCSSGNGGIQFATAQLPLLKLMDCGMTICDLDSQNPPLEVSGNNEPPNALNSKLMCKKA